MQEIAFQILVKFYARWCVPVRVIYFMQSTMNFLGENFALPENEARTRFSNIKIKFMIAAINNKKENGKSFNLFSASATASCENVCCWNVESIKSIM